MLYSDSEKFIKDVYWNETHDKRSNLNIVDLVASRLLAIAKEKDPEYYEKKAGVIHASSLSKCLKGVALELLGAKPDKELEARQAGIFQAGNLFEEFIINTLGDRVIERQREYSFKYKSLTLVGRSDFTMNDEGIPRVGEIKSVHSDSFWYRQKAGELIAYHNQIQLQIYMWLERMIYQHSVDGIFFYVSKDDVTVEGATVKFNQRIIDECVIPALDYLNEAFEKQDASLVPMPAAVVFNQAKGQYQKNWLCTYCDYHNQCAGVNWILEAEGEVKAKNKALKDGLGDKYAVTKKAKPEITVEK